LPVLTSTAPNLTDQLWMVFGSSASSWSTLRSPLPYRICSQVRFVNYRRTTRILEEISWVATARISWTKSFFRVFSNVVFMVGSGLPVFWKS
jgi:hypothetical protein